MDTKVNKFSEIQNSPAEPKEKSSEGFRGTPGEWKIATGKPTTVESSEGVKIAVTSYQSSESKFPVPYKIVNDPEEAEANAKLIAQAPMMLKALQEISKGEGAFNRDPMTHAENTIDNMKEIANAAIKRALS